MRATFRSVLIILIILPVLCLAKRTITGKITDKYDNPISKARVRAYDHDTLSGDDLMKTAFTNSYGYYTMEYEGKHWDPAPHRVTTWRPDIYIRVSVRVAGRCDGEEWNASANWKKIGESRIYSNHKIRNDLTIDHKARDYPEDNIVAVKFTECKNKLCSYNFFFHYHCKGFYDGKKIEWSEWGSFPYFETRCINLDDLDNAPEWSQRDINDMNRECNNRILDVVGADSGAQALEANCGGTYCKQLKFSYNKEKKGIIIFNDSEESVELKFIAKPFKNRRKMRITHYLHPNDSISVPPLNYKQLKVKRFSLKENKYYLELKTSYQFPSDESFRGIYQGGIIPQLGFGIKAIDQLDVGINVGYFGSTGELPITKEETDTDVSIISLGIESRYKILNGDLSLYAGAGITYNFYLESNPLGEVNDSGVGFMLEFGSLYKLSDSLSLDIFVDYSYCQLQPKEVKFNIGGIKTGIGVKYDF